MRSNRITLAIVAVLLFACELAQSHGAEHSRTRAEFAAAVAKIKEGMPEKEVLELLGKPDDIRTQFDPGGIGRVQTREIWCYGAKAHLSFPTLGCVYMDVNGRSQEGFGGKGQPPKADMFTEDELGDLLRLLDTAPGLEGYSYNPLPVIQIINTLQPLGKEKALAAIAEYVRVSDEWSGFGGPRSGMFLVLTVLFDLPRGIYPDQAGSFGAPSPGPPKDPGRIPRFPIAIIDNIPLMLVRGYTLAGMATPMENVVDFYRSKGSIRATPLVPSNDPLSAITHLTSSKQWIYGDTNLQITDFSISFGPAEEARSEKSMLMEQLLRLVDSVYRMPADVYGNRLPWGEPAEAAWQKIVADVSALTTQWDSRQDMFVFRDGRHLPIAAKKIYQRQIWKLADLGFEDAELVLERKSDSWVDVIVSHSEKSGAALRPASLFLFDGDDGKPPLLTFSFTNEVGSGGSTIESRTIGLKPGSELTAKLVTTGDRTNSSPVLKP
jgi:hypothetical protein